MKRVLISAIAAGALLGQLGAAEIYKDGDKSFGVFGVANAVVGYGFNFTSNTNDATRNGYKKAGQGEFIYGIQGNSRIGINFTVGKLFGAALIGAGESTLLGGGETAGFRQLYAGYDFGDAGKLLAGKNELVTSMGGFSSSIFDTESGLNGFGGASTSTRRFQIAYSVAGFTIAMSENDASGVTAAGQGYEVPRFSLGYEYNQDGLRAKVAASYAYVRANSTRTATGEDNVFLLTAGVKPTFGDQYVSALLTYGLNSHLVKESKISKAYLGEGFFNSLKVSTDTNLGGNAKDINLVALMLEYGINLTNDFALKVGAGYQFATNAKAGSELQTGQIHAYSAFVQLPYKVGGGFSIIPQVGYLGTTMASNKVSGSKRNYTNTGDVLAEVLFKLAF